MIWFRWYNGTCADPKLGSIARRAAATRERVIATWAMVLESAADVSDGGRFKIDADGIADVLNCETASIEAILAEMSAVGMLSGGTVAAFSRRNFNSDNSTERVRKHREHKRNDSETFQDRFVTPPEAEADTEAEAETDGKEGLSTSEGYQKKQRAAAAVGAFCSRMGCRWKLLVPIEDWTEALRREPRFAGLDLPYEVGKAGEWYEEHHKKLKDPARAIRNWLEKSAAHVPRNGNGNGKTLDPEVQRVLDELAAEDKERGA